MSVTDWKVILGLVIGLGLLIWLGPMIGCNVLCCA